LLKSFVTPFRAARKPLEISMSAFLDALSELICFPRTGGW